MKKRVTIVDPADWPETINDNVNWKLLQACVKRHVPLASEALSQGANVNCRTSSYLTPLHIAVENDDVILIQLLCDQPSVNIESKAMGGLTPLHMATFLGHTDAVTKLLENGAAVDCTDNLSRYPLHYAALKRDIDSATVLLTNNANVNVYDVFHESPLYTSVMRRRSFSMIKLLLSFGATISSAPHKHTLGLLLELVLSAQSISDIYVLDILFQNGIDLNTADSIGLRTPLHIAAMTGNLMLAMYLIEEGADLYRKNRAGYTPLEVALRYKNFKVVELIEYVLNFGKITSISNEEYDQSSEKSDSMV